MKKIYFLVLFSTISGFSQIAQVKDIYTGVTIPGAALPAVINSGNPTNLIDFNGTLIFRANNGTNGIELWKSDGSAAGTAMIADINTVSTTPNSNPSNLTLFQNKVFFNAQGGDVAPATGQELYSSSGTAIGTAIVTDLNPGIANGNPFNLVVLNPTTMLFAGNNGTSGSELFKTDGTATGTVNVFDAPGTTNSPSWIANLNGTAIIGYTVTGGTGRELYKSTGAVGNCDLILDINPGTASGVGTISYTALGNVFFTANSGTTGTELWKTNGTTAGTSLVKDINVGTGSSSVGDFATLGSNVYFVATNGMSGNELWKSDGTATGTIEVLDINVGATGSNPSKLTTIGSKIFYFAADSAAGTDLYVYDGTTNLKLLDLNATTTSAYNTNFVAIGSLIYFSVDSNDVDTKRELWQTDGTAIGTVPVAPLSALNQNAVDINNITLSNGKLFFAAEVADGTELFSYTPLSLSSNNFELSNLNIYPNPTSGIINIANDLGLSISYKFYDVLGKNISNGKIGNNQLEINVDKGIYFLELTSESGTITKKIIKN